MEEFLITEFYEKMKNVHFGAYGIIDAATRIHTLGTDSKIIGRVFEMLAQPVLEEIAVTHGLILKTPESQTVYPDFVMMTDEASKDKIAIDIKTTYIDTAQSSIKFTLGSFGSYMRNNTKNIEYTYTDYTRHYVIGFVYKRNDSAQASRVYSYEDREKIEFPYSNVRYFIQEKYKIAGDKPGSGNTENIGSFPTRNFQDLVAGNGPFSRLGTDAFDLYWKHYPLYRTASKAYTSLDGFMDWFLQQETAPELLHEYNYERVIESIKLFRGR